MRHIKLSPCRDEIIHWLLRSDLANSSPWPHGLGSPYWTNEVCASPLCPGVGRETRERRTQKWQWAVPQSKGRGAFMSFRSSTSFPVSVSPSTIFSLSIITQQAATDGYSGGINWESESLPETLTSTDTRAEGFLRTSDQQGSDMNQGFNLQITYWEERTKVSFSF